MREFHRTTVTVILGLVAVSAVAQTPIVYPAKGQSAEQQQQEQAAAQNTAAQQQAEAQKQQQLATYQRANAACLEGRGYVLK